MPVPEQSRPLPQQAWPVPDNYPEDFTYPADNSKRRNYGQRPPFRSLKEDPGIAALHKTMRDLARAASRPDLNPEIAEYYNKLINFRKSGLEV